MMPALGRHSSRTAPEAAPHPPELPRCPGRDSCDSSSPMASADGRGGPPPSLPCSPMPPPVGRQQSPTTSSQPSADPVECATAHRLLFALSVFILAPVAVAVYDTNGPSGS